MRAINVLLAILVSLAIGLLVFEGGLRLIGKGPQVTLNRFDPVTGWANKKSFELRRNGEEFNVTFVTNALGHRDDPMDSPAKPDGVFRVLMVGDSFTLGYTVDRADLFVDLAETHWNGEGRNVEVINVGTMGWSTDQEVAWVQEHGADYDPDLVLLLPYDNDVFYCGEDSYTGLAKPVYDAAGKLESGELADATGHWSRSTGFGRLFGGLVGAKENPPMFATGGGKALPGDFAMLTNKAPSILGDAPDRAKAALGVLKAECAKLGAELVVAPIPSNASADPDFAKQFGSATGLTAGSWNPDGALEFFLTACDDLGIRALDARAAMKAANAKEPCYFDFFGPDREWHFNAAGNRAFAQFLVTELDGALPAKKQEAPEMSAAVVASTGGGGIDWGFVGRLYGILFVALTALYFMTYRDEPAYLPPIKVGLILALVFSIFLGVMIGVEELEAVSPAAAQYTPLALVLIVLGFVGYKLGGRIATVAELMKAFVLRGHWYLMPMVVILLTIGSLLVVAASSPFVAPFIYTLF